VHQVFELSLLIVCSNLIATMRNFGSVDHSRTESVLSTASRHTSTSTARQNPFSTPPASVFGGTSGFYALTSVAGGHTYFRSRRIKKDDNHVPPVFKKDPKEKFLWIIPLCGLLLGLAITGVLIYLKIGRLSPHNYCPVLDDDFSSGVLNPAVWTKEIEVGGYG
jgi:hypothetical protein